ncbi:MAG: Maf-like protein [Paludibacteraceae bacterium]
MLQHLQKYNIILGSNSPRRKELLNGLDIDFKVITNNIDESYPSNIANLDIPRYLAEKKANSYLLTNEDLLITADTIVWLDNTVYGKPTDRTDAKKMLKALSGRKHQVITGVCIRTLRQTKIFHAITDVYFNPLSDSQIGYYLDNYKPYDKAGSYGVQEWIGYVAVERIDGSYFNVMGLPIHQLYHELLEWK